MSYCCVSGATGENKWSGRLEGNSINIWVMFRYSVHTVSTSDVPDSNSCIPRARKQAPRNFRRKCKSSDILSMRYFCIFASKYLNGTARDLLYIPDSDGLVVWTTCNNIGKVLVEDHVVNSCCVTFKGLDWVFWSIVGVEDSYPAILGTRDE